MQRLYLWALLALPTFASAQDGYTCLAQTMYAEAQGEPIAGVIAVGHATLNRAKAQKRRLCNVTGVARKPIPANRKAQFLWIAKGIINKQIPDNTKGATAWNTGTKPAYPGDVTRIIGKHVIYQMAEYE